MCETLYSAYSVKIYAKVKYPSREKYFILGETTKSYFLTHFYFLIALLQNYENT